MKVFLFCLIQLLVVFGKHHTKKQQRHAVRHVVSREEKDHHIHKRAVTTTTTTLTLFRDQQLKFHNYYRSLHGVPSLTLDNTNTEWFSVQDSVIHAREMLRDFRKADKKHEPQASVFCFPKVEQHPKCMDHAILHGKTIRLNDEAQRYADHLAKNSISTKCHFLICNPSMAGENIAFIKRHGGDATSKVTANWYKSVYDYDFCHSSSNVRGQTRPGHEGADIYQFTQVVWGTTTQVGFGLAVNRKTGNMYVVARYLPGGNIPGLFSMNVLKPSYLLHTYADNCLGEDGNFTEWSGPGACSKACGKGVRFQHRTCTNPKPSLNGKACVGDTKKIYHRWCNVQICSKPTNERDEQCRSRGYQPTSYYFSSPRTLECRLFCLDIGVSNFYRRRGMVDDGTVCNGGQGACLNGHCILLSSEPTLPSTIVPPVIPKNKTTSVVTPVVKPLPVTPPPITKPGPPQVVHGGWSAWGPHTRCSKTCGGGYGYRNRTCTNPVPSYDGQPCKGPSVKLDNVWCNPQPCYPIVLERDEQCQQRGLYRDGHNFGKADECRLYCKDPQSDTYKFGGFVNNGTTCNANTGLCLHNSCFQMTHERGTIIRGTYRGVPRAEYWKNIFLELPRGARNVVIANHKTTSVKVVLGYRSLTSYGYNPSDAVMGVPYTKNSTHILIKGPIKPKAEYQLVAYALGSAAGHVDFKYEM